MKASKRQKKTMPRPAPSPGSGPANPAVAGGPVVQETAMPPPPARPPVAKGPGWGQSLSRHLVAGAAAGLFFYAVAAGIVNYRSKVDPQKIERLKQESEAWVSYLPARAETPEERLLARWIHLGDPVQLFQTRSDTQGFGALQRRAELVHPVPFLPESPASAWPGPQAPFAAGAFGQGLNPASAAAAALVATPETPVGKFAGRMLWHLEDGSPLEGFPVPSQADIAAALDKNPALPAGPVRLEISQMRQCVRCRILPSTSVPGSSGNPALDALALRTLYEHLERQGILFRTQQELPPELKAGGETAAVVQFDYRFDPAFYKLQHQKAAGKETP